MSTKTGEGKKMGAKRKWLDEIVFETGRHFVMRYEHGFQVFRNEGTHSQRVSTIGFKGQIGLDRAKAEIARREAL